MDGVLPSSMTVLKEGILTKLGEKVHSWRRRHFVLRHDESQLHFSYYKTANAKDALGGFRLCDVSCFRVLAVPDSPLSQKAVMEIVTPKRTYQMHADTESELREWTWVIERTLSYLRERAQQQQQEQQQAVDSSSSGINGDNGDSSSASASASHVRKSGLLMKKGAKRHNWKLRWFVLDRQQGTLCYYSSKPDKRKHPYGTLVLDQCLLVTRLVERRADNRFTFSIDMPGRTYHIATNGEIELHDWLRALERCGCPISHVTSRSNSTFFVKMTGGGYFGGGGALNGDSRTRTASGDRVAILSRAAASAGDAVISEHSGTDSEDEGGEGSGEYCPPLDHGVVIAAAAAAAAVESGGS
eukprot:UC1_evm1s1931